jgi:alkane 1-monooxygenase
MSFLAGSFTAQAVDGKTIRYVDGKRYLWLMSLTGPFIPMLSVYWYLASGHNTLTLLFPLAYTFIVIPLLDVLMGEDRHNPPEEVVPEMARDNYYRFLLYVAITLLYTGFFVVAWFIGTHALPWWGMLLFSLGAGYSSSMSLLIGHELGHKNNALDKRGAQIVNALVGYGHFCIEHNRGHHVQVSTPEDFASSRMGESIYKFVRREIPGALRRGWANEQERLAKLGFGMPWTWRNEILQSWTLTAVIAVALIAAYGWVMVPFLAIHHFYGWYGLTQANYVEHYGLLRKKLPNGRYELCEPHHSWNTNHIYSNLISFHLQRHSDHHANALRPYQALRDFDNLPRLPSGYPGCFGMASIPRLWFKIMDPKVMTWAGGDITKVNIDPEKKAKLYAKYGKQADQPLAA